MNYFAH